MSLDLPQAGLKHLLGAGSVFAHFEHAPAPTFEFGLESIPLHVAAAFVQAEGELGTDWKLAGRGHCARVVLDPRYSRVARQATRSWVRISPSGAFAQRLLFPRVLVNRAAQIPGVAVSTIMGREYGRLRPREVKVATIAGSRLRRRCLAQSRRKALSQRFLPFANRSATSPLREGRFQQACENRCPART